jgi:N-acetylglucosamine repressor
MRKINTRDFVRATRFTSREINRRIALNLVREHQPLSRAELARQMKVGRSTVTTLVNELLAEGAIYEGESVEVPRGRKPKMLHIRTRDRYVIAVDVRFSQSWVMLGDFGGRQIALEAFDTLYAPDELAAELGTRIRRILQMHGANDACEGIGLVVPGMVDQRTGRVLNSPQLQWRDVDICTILADVTGLPVYIDNAPIACALAQMWLTNNGESSPSDFVYVTVSDGVGAGVVVNGSIVRGSGFTAGEFGHAPIGFEGEQCLCGARGCLEAYTSNLATISRYLGHELSRDYLRETGLTMADLITRARMGDARAESAIRETGRYLGLMIATIVNTLNPDRIFIGGEITGAWDLIMPGIRQSVADRALSPTAAATPIVPEQIGGFPRLLGALALVAAPLFAAPQVA